MTDKTTVYEELEKARAAIVQISAIADRIESTPYGMLNAAFDNLAERALQAQLLIEDAMKKIGNLEDAS